MRRNRNIGLLYDATCELGKVDNEFISVCLDGAVAIHVVVKTDQLEFGIHRNQLTPDDGNS